MLAFLNELLFDAEEVLNRSICTLRYLARLIKLLRLHCNYACLTASNIIMYLAADPESRDKLRLPLIESQFLSLTK